MARGDDPPKRRRSGGGGRRSSTPTPPPARHDDRDRDRSRHHHHRRDTPPRSPKRSRREETRSLSPDGPRGGKDGGPPLQDPLDIAVAVADAFVGLADKAAGLPADAAAPPPPTRRVAHIVEALLDGKKGTWASARLAARLLPPLIARVPSHMESAVAFLIRLADGRCDALWPAGGHGRALPPLVQALADTASADAVASLGQVVAGAADLPPSDPAVQKAVAYLLTRWAADPRSAPGREGDQWEEGAGRESAPGESQPEEGEAAEAPVDARAALRAAFRGNPRAVLRGLATAAGSGRPSDAGAAEAALRGILLRPDPFWACPGDAASDAAADAEAGVDPVSARKLGPAAAPDPPPALAATVLGPAGGPAARGARAWLESEAGGGGGGGGRAGGRLLRQVASALPAVVEERPPSATAGAGWPAATAAAAAGPADALPTTPAAAAPAPSVVGSTLRLAPLPPAATTADITAACSRHAPVRAVRLLATAGAADVEFADVSAAALAFEALASVCPPPWWGRAGGKGAPPAVDARFTAIDPPPTGPAYVWAPRVGSDAALGAAISTLQAAGGDPPTGTLRVAGRAPCVIFQFADGRTARLAANALAEAAATAAAGRENGGDGPGTGGLASFPAAGAGGPPSGADPLLLSGAAAAEDDFYLQGVSAGTWTGALAKGGVVVCEGLACLDGPDASAPPGSAASAEPSGWPPSLDMTFRVDAAFVLQAVLDSAPPDSVTVRRLALEAGAPRAARAAFVTFLNELAARRRAGVVELPGPDGAATYLPGAPPPARRLYLVPPSNSVAARLGVEWAPNECLFVVVAPPGGGGG